MSLITDLRIVFAQLYGLLGDALVGVGEWLQWRYHSVEQKLRGKHESRVRDE